MVWNAPGSAYRHRLSRDGLGAIQWLMFEVCRKWLPRGIGCRPKCAVLARTIAEAAEQSDAFVSQATLPMHAPRAALLLRCGGGPRADARVLSAPVRAHAQRYSRADLLGILPASRSLP